MKYRIKFSKYGAIKYIGHLDVMRYFQKAIRRAEIPVAYSEGFSPHQILSFAFPLSVGMTSEGEYFDVELTEEVDEECLVSKLQSTMVDGIDVLKARKLPDKSENCMAAVFAAKYQVVIEDDIELPEDYENQFIDYFGQMTIPVNKPKKKGGGTISIDLKDFLYEFSINGKNIFFTVNASSSNNIKPDFVMSCFYESMGFAAPEYSYRIHRIDILGNKGDENSINLVSLLDY